MRKPDVDGGAVEALLREVFGTAVRVTYERTAEGNSTQVYRVRRGPATFYLRIAEEPGENLETDAELLDRLRQLGVGVSKVIHVEAGNARIGRSTMVTTEIPGIPLTEIASPAAASVLERAGADLATIGQLPVDGFGFVRRLGRGWPLTAEHADYPAWVVSSLPEPWPGPLASLFDRKVLATIEELIQHERANPPRQAVLAHGDFDATQIFRADVRYTGLIDFGEIRGAEPLFDLGHFHLWHGTVPVSLLRGYQRVRALPADHEQAIRRSAILLGLRQLCRWLGPPRRSPHDAPAVRDRVRRINELVIELVERSGSEGRAGRRWGWHARGSCASADAVRPR